MKRLIALSAGLAWAAAAAAEPPAYPITVPPYAQGKPVSGVRQVSVTDVTQPLPAAVSSVAPVGPLAPTVPPPGPGVMPYPQAGYPAVPGPGCYPQGSCCPQGGGCERDERSCLRRFRDWLCFQPGPRVLPVLTPTPYQAPLRAYFPCRPGDCLAAGGCNPTAGCGAAGCAGPGCEGGRPGLLSGRLAGVFHRDSAPAGYGPVVSGAAVVPSAPQAAPGPIGYGYAPQVVADGSVAEGGHTSLLHRMTGWFTGKHSGQGYAGAYPYGPVEGGVEGPAASFAGMHFADPIRPGIPLTSYNTGVTAPYTRPASQPLTNP